MSLGSFVAGGEKADNKRSVVTAPCMRPCSPSSRIEGNSWIGKSKNPAGLATSRGKTAIRRGGGVTGRMEGFPSNEFCKNPQTRFVQGAGQMVAGGGAHNRITNDFTSGDPQGRHIDTIGGRYAAGNASRINRERSGHPAPFHSVRSNANDEDESRSWRSGVTSS
ncbi:hypothetical protein K0M31_005061 [Melipona bicolor]|uniref:Uncharacterized protein n=1 Tax=Melipona bicolor TaxID=60889 RepID=A0AA40FW15_9HYME|nr:hypothetical protein K0M31_005061 [Melipona bicolor]